MSLNKFLQSLENHQIKPSQAFALNIILNQSHNTYIKYPCRGVLVITELGVDLSIIQAVFHTLNADESLGAPVAVKHPIFSNVD